jgi:hypothetical protein
MKLTLQFAVLLSLTSVVSSAASFRGALVDAGCFDSAQNNTSHGHPGSGDIKRALHSCAPNEKTTRFSVVPQVGMAIHLDADGNDKAHNLVLKEGKKSPFMVNVTGDSSEDILKVTAITISK